LSQIAVEPLQKRSFERPVVAKVHCLSRLKKFVNFSCEIKRYSLLRTWCNGEFGLKRGTLSNISLFVDNCDTTVRDVVNLDKGTSNYFIESGRELGFTSKGDCHNSSCKSNFSLFSVNDNFMKKLTCRTSEIRIESYGQRVIF
jgi:hypothetical protein